LTPDDWPGASAPGNQPGAAAPAGQPGALLLDYGGVVHRSTLELIADLAARHPELSGVARRRGPLGADHDELWAQMMRREITEREYWSKRAAEIGRVFGADWGVRDLMTWIDVDELTESERVRPEAAELVADVRAAGLQVGVLTNDMAAFHDDDWIRGQQMLSQVDVLYDGSLTGVLKPDPRCYLDAAERLGTAPERVVFVDDIPWNVAGAEAVGMTACLLDYTEPGIAFGLARKWLGLPARPS
jgi:putative hydrolase of the HAD superfamily